MSFESIIQRLTAPLNQVNDTVIGGQAGITGLSKFAGQLGKPIFIPADFIAQVYNPTIGTLYQGWYRYVQLKSDAAQPVIGQSLFWDDASAPSAFVATTAQNTTTYVATSMAGVYLGGIEPGNYGWVQMGGVATVKYVPSITGTKATGRPVSISQAGTTSLGFADVDDTPTPELFMGWAIDLPADGGTGRVNLGNLLGLR